MATKIDKTLDSLVLRPADEKLMLDVRRTFLLRQGAIPKLPTALSTVIQSRGITYWEQLGCIGYNPELSLLEATITLKRPTGYSGDLCSNGSLEYVRFFIDWEDGTGWHDVGVSSVRVHDVSDAAPGDQHPLAYLVQHRIDVERRMRPCNTRRPLLPKVRGVLSWNTLPPVNPNVLPLYGNRVDTRIQIASRRRLFFRDFKALDVASSVTEALSPFFDSATSVTFKPQAATVEELLPLYRNLKIPDHRTLAGTHATVFAKQQSKIQEVSASLWDTAKFDIDLDDVVTQMSNTAADTSFEELSCIGFSPMDDTLGAVIRIKQESGYNGGLCRRGSPEYVAFWADWDNDGTFEQYLGTASVVLHDIPRAGVNEPLDYAVRLYSPEFSEHLRNCRVSNVVGIRAVLSWCPGLLKVVHPYFGRYDLDLQPDSSSTLVPSAGQPLDCQSLIDDGPEAGTWSLDTAALPRCGYTVRLQGWDRTLVNDGNSNHYGVKYVGFAVS